jgi:hypothetical protein
VLVVIPVVLCRGGQREYPLEQLHLGFERGHQRHQKRQNSHQRHGFDLHYFGYASSVAVFSMLIVLGINYLIHLALKIAKVV